MRSGYTTITIWGSSKECERARRMIADWGILKDLAEIGKRTGVSVDIDLYTEGARSWAYVRQLSTTNSSRTR